MFCHISKKNFSGLDPVPPGHEALLLFISQGRNTVTVYEFEKKCIRYSYWLKYSAIKLRTESFAWFWLLQFSPFS